MAGGLRLARPRPRSRSGGLRNAAAPFLQADPIPPFACSLSLYRNRIGEDGETERKRRWFGDSEFIYTMDAARGHLPLTSALRGTSLIKEIFAHPLWEEEEFNKKDKADKKERKF